jgi:hypothetical protein
VVGNGSTVVTTGTGNLAGTWTMTYNGSATITATPATGYSVNYWKVDGVQDSSANGSTTYEVDGVTASHTITVYFVATPQ